jgi:F-type H+-transporting ATPase subunit c
MKKLVGLTLLIGIVMSLTASVALAGAPVKNTDSANKEVQTANPDSISFSGAGIGAGIGAGLTIIGAGWGFGKIGAAALEGMARQPEVAGALQTGMIVVAALLEGATFFALVVLFILGGKSAF